MTTTIPTPAELSRLALAEAQSTHAEALTLHDQHQTAVEELRAFLTSGRASLSDFDSHQSRWRDIHAAQDVAALLVTGCENYVKRAERGLINDDTTVADLFADVLADVYGGELLVRVVTVKADVRPNDDGSPVLFIVQEKAGENRAGILSAKLFLTYYRGALHAPLNAEAIQEACRARNYSVQIDPWPSQKHGPHYEDPTAVNVTRAFMAVPTLDAEPTDGQVSRYANVVRNVLRNAVTFYGERDGVRLMYEPIEGAAESETVSYRVLTNSQGKGDRRMTVEVVCKVWPDKLLMGQPVAEMMKEAVRKQVGNMADDLGRVAAIDHLAVDVPDLGRRFGNADPFVVTAHLGLMYRIG
ncbi:hypothetical protein [Modestobacter sp. VKM Ac-2985]|uniref:hypothetical protein n=1 Tax=Modestobacter sp. VKM Ac-2985 TaxID=3004139 RepID=UPI0022AB7541|nr:hypothetical protein [Modestobacter sp. VKM Ac-2985]MCZ2837090.1 hypothetical protein [Modestobacter sp. VKM Ac-2985]